MKRRLYFLLPDVDHAARAVADLRRMAIRRRHIHSIAREDIDIRSLPSANTSQRRDRNHQLENWFWDVNLMVFFAALAGFAVLALFSTPNWIWAIPVVIMAATFVFGFVFTSRIPNVHLDEFRDALAHGEILLMVDVPVNRVAGIEAGIERLHPEAVAGGVGWTVEALHI